MTRPPWIHKTPRERENMVLWVHRKLDELQEAQVQPRLSEAERAARSNGQSVWLKNCGPEIEAADRGNIEPLRRKLPHLARFLVAPPKRKRAKPERQVDLIEVALWAYKHIGKIWADEYDGRTNRRNDQVSKFEIAMRWADLDVEDEEKEKEFFRRLKPSGPSGKKKPVRKEVSRAD